MAKINVYRILRSSIPLTTFTLLTILVTFHLYHRTIPLGNLQHIGWQAYDLVSFGNVSAPSTSEVETSTPSKPISTNDTSTDWWDVIPDETEALPTSFRLDVWNPLLPHRTGLTEITIKPCLFPPGLVNYCKPRTTEEEDALKGSWVLVERDLNARTGRWYLNIWYRRSRRLDVPLITSLLILADDEIELLPEPKSLWHKASGSLLDGVRGAGKDLYLWYRLRPPLADATDDEEIEAAITELDIHYGDDQPYFGFERVKPNVYTGDEKIESVSVVYRRGVKTPPKAKPPHFHHDGTYKILQIADLHYSVSQGQCRDVDPANNTCTYGDTSTSSLLASALDAEKPDLVVFTGDQLNGQGTSWDAKSVMSKFTRMVTERNISWAAVLGNHDTESNMGRKEEMRYLEKLPYSLTKAGPEDVHGAGNYLLKVLSPDPSKTHVLTLYFLDSGSYADKGWQWWKPTEYDWIRPTQRDWFLEQSGKIDPIERPFTPDGAKDLGNLDFGISSTKVSERQGKTLGKPNAMMFFHIPLPEAYEPADHGPDTKAYELGSQIDAPGAAKHNGMFFEEAILRSHEREGDMSSLVEVKVIGNGHCHLTDRCRRVNGVWMCFGGGGSYSGYGKIGFDRRFRVYQVEDFGETIKTYKRTERGEIMDQQVLVRRDD